MSFIKIFVYILSLKKKRETTRFGKKTANGTSRCQWILYLWQRGRWKLRIWRVLCSTAGTTLMDPLCTLDCIHSLRLTPVHRTLSVSFYARVLACRYFSLFTHTFFLRVAFSHRAANFSHIQSLYLAFPLPPFPSSFFLSHSLLNSLISQF